MQDLGTDSRCRILERIADAEVEAEGVECGGDVEVGVDGLGVVGFPLFVVLVGLVGRVDGDTQVQTDNESVQVETQACTGAEGNLTQQVRVVDDSVVQFPAQLQLLYVIGDASGFEEVGGTIPVPHVACIHERGAVQFPDDREAQFEVRFQFDIAGVEEVLVVFSE